MFVIRGLPAAAILALLAGCGQPPAENRQQSPRPAATRAAPPPPAKVEASADETADLAGLSPRQRRAYERGLADCRAGRYDPDRYPEAYRIGCAAANDR
ncbi:MAG TPA: hypothetical protein VK614_13140 [Allosphingosinicella sp.]|nr:hypothetical protein [Allosphingosinicella sp.]